MTSSFRRERLQDLDARDPLAAMRTHFEIPAGLIYLDGNSLGALPKRVADRLESVIRHEWGEGLIRSWTQTDWYELPRLVGERIAPLIGAAADEVIATDSTSANLFKLAAAAVHMRPGRKVLLTERGNFQTDVYILESLASMFRGGIILRVIERPELIAAIDEDVALVVLTHVHYRTGEIFDMAGVTAAAQARGALALWDLSHSAGALQVDLNGAGADMAVGCGYKFLNGGPGAPAYLFAARRHHEQLRQPLSGWAGHARPFAFEDRYEPASAMGRFLCGSPPILGLAALHEALAVFAGVNMADIRAKSSLMGDLFIELLQPDCARFGLTLVSPTDSRIRGSHVSLVHPQGFAITRSLAAHGLICDYREPGAMRFGFSPLYLRYQDIGRAIEILRHVMTEQLYNQAEYQRRHAVT